MNNWLKYMGMYGSGPAYLYMADSTPFTPYSHRRYRKTYKQHQRKMQKRRHK